MVYCHVCGGGDSGKMIALYKLNNAPCNALPPDFKLSVAIPLLSAALPVFSCRSDL